MTPDGRHVVLPHAQPDEPYGFATAPLYRWAAPSCELVEALREFDATTEQLRLEHPEWFPDDVPDPRDCDAFERWLDERQ